MQTVNYTPVKVDINVEEITLSSEGFYQVGFITQNDNTERTIIVRSLNEVVENGFDYGSKAYNFCLGVFAQKSMDAVVIRSKRSNESYFDAYLADSNSDYYFTVIESKDINDIISFNDLLVSTSDVKLQFFSSSNNVSSLVENRKIVYFYQPTFEDGFLLLDSDNVTAVDDGRWISLSDKTFYSDGTSSWAFDEEELVAWDSNGTVLLEPQDISPSEANKKTLAYPEGAWIGLCGSDFPSHVQWLHKFVERMEWFDLVQIPDFSTACVRVYGRDKATVGTAETCEKYPINEQVSLDWVKYALQRKLWNLLYNSKKINATVNGLQILENQIKEILDVAVNEGIFTDYLITKRELDRFNSKASFKFVATLTHSILGVDKVEGNIYK